MNNETVRLNEQEYQQWKERRGLLMTDANMKEQEASRRALQAVMDQRDKNKQIGTPVSALQELMP